MMPLEVFFILTIDINNILMEYGNRKLFFIKSLFVYSNDKIGIIGENGVGKTTLLDIIAGKTKPINGTITMTKDFSYITQGVNYDQPDNQIIESYKWHVPQNPFSGGEVTRAKIADAIAYNSNLLLCDEPTSNLDEKGILQLENTLYHYKGAVLLVSHDRKLMDKICTKIWEIKDGQINVHCGNYSSYKEQLDKTRKNQQKEYDKYIHKKKSLQSAVNDRSNKAKSMTKTPKRMGNSEARLHRMDVKTKAGKISSLAKNVKTRLENLEVKDKPKKQTSYKMVASANNKIASKIAIDIKDLSFAYGNIKILDNISFEVKRGDKVCITGDNASGKTTLLNCIINKSSGIRINPSDEIGYFKQNCLDLDENKTILECVMKKSKLPEYLSRTVLAELGIKRDNVFKKISVLSGGEKCKVSLSSLLCQQCSVLILDEPTNYLDIYVLESLENMLQEYNGTLICVSHDRYFRQKVTDRELLIKNGKIIEVNNYKTANSPSSNNQAKLVLLELKANQIIDKKKGLSEIQHEQMDKEYNKIMEQIKDLKKDL